MAEIDTKNGLNLYENYKTSEHEERKIDLRFKLLDLVTFLQSLSGRKFFVIVATM